MTSRLGWVAAPRQSLADWERYVAFAAAARDAGLDRYVVCGMGGSSLAPRVLATSFGRSALSILDSTDPADVRAIADTHDPARTLFLIVSKSGGTIETLAAYQFFAGRVRPDHFVAVTDPGSPLETLAREQSFRAVFPHPADVGGRYAALTVVGMLPAALLEIDGQTLLSRAEPIDPEAAKARGAALAAAAIAGRDKLLLRPPPRVAALADWIEQLVAESSGKDGRGVVPVVDAEPSGRPDEEVVTEFSADPLDLGVEFLRWEYATWELCARLGVDAFDQPNVEEAKAQARAELARPAGAASATVGTLTPEALRAAARPGDYLALLAYVPARADVMARLQRVRAAWGRALGIATTLGLGPRYLHSTGQLHKGGPNTGLFLVITADPTEDLEIPHMGTTFGRVQRAQAHGDMRALLARGRRVAHVHLRRLEDLESLAAV